MNPHAATQRRIAILLELLRHEAAAGVLVVIAAIVALIIDNSFLSPAYDALLGTPVQVRIGDFKLDKNITLVINDCLMAVFFLLVGLEIKREVVEGELSSRERALLPLFGALGGMLAPALIYWAFNAGNATAMRGWAIPTATDIAFAVAVVSSLGTKVPAPLKIFLLALAIVDDLGAIVIIALFYTAQLSWTALAMATVGIAGLAILNRLNVQRIAPYVLVGSVIWLFVLKSGVHATLAGVVTAMFIPAKAAGSEEAEAPLHRLVGSLHTWVAYGILPMFAFANAGVSLQGVTIGTLFQPIALGIALGLLIGKPIGILVGVWVGIRLGLCRLPEGTTWPQMLGIGMLAGIGFTMSLFIGMLAFPDPTYATVIRVSVLTGSIAAAVLGYVLLRTLGRNGPSDSTTSA